MHLVGYGLDQVAQEVAGHPRVSLLVQLDEACPELRRRGEPGRAVDGHEGVELALLRSYLSYVDVEAEWVGFELPLGGAFDLRYPGYAILTMLYR